MQVNFVLRLIQKFRQDCRDICISSVQQLYTSLLQSKVNAKTEIDTFGLPLERFYFEEELHDTYNRICDIKYSLCCFFVGLVVLLVWMIELFFGLVACAVFGLVGCAVFRFGWLCCF